MTEMDPRHTGQDPTLDEALRNFRMSVHAWSDAAYNSPRTVAASSRSGVWRAVSGWALGCALVAGIVSGGVYKYQRGEELRQQAEAAHQRELQRQMAAHSKKEDADALLARVDSAISRQVPAAMDPLADLLGED